MNENISTINNWLVIWASIGPVLTGVITTIYNRRKQIEDRNYESGYKKEIAKEQRFQERIEKQIAVRKEQFLCTKQLILNFHKAARGVHLQKLKIWRENPYEGSEGGSKLLDDFCLLTEQLSTCFAELYLHVPTIEVLKSSVELLTHVTEETFTGKLEDEVSSLCAKFKQLNSGFLKSSRQYSEKEEQEIIDLIQDG